MKKVPMILLCALLIFGIPQVAPAQTGTPHGVFVTFVIPAAPVGGSGTIAGYNIFRCAGTCSAASGIWVKLDGTLDLTNSYLDASSGLTPGQTYSYAATTVDTNANESVFSNVAIVVWPSTPPTNPAAPSGCNGKVQ